MPAAPPEYDGSHARLGPVDRAFVEQFLASAHADYALGTDRTARHPHARHVALWGGEATVLGVGALVCEPGSDPELAVAVVPEHCPDELFCALVRAVARSDGEARRVVTCFAWGGEPSEATLKGAGVSVCAQVSCDGMTDVILAIEPIEAR